MKEKKEIKEKPKKTNKNKEKKIKKIEEKKEKGMITFYKVVVIGAGLAGITLAKKLAKNNVEVLLIDKTEPSIKSSLNIEIFTHMVNEISFSNFDVNTFFASLPIRINSMNKKLNEHNNVFAIKKEGIDFMQGEAEIVQKDMLIINEQEIYLKNLVFASGSHYDEESYQNIPAELRISADQINKINKKYKSIAIYGSNSIALELAQAFSKLGIKVYLVDKNVNPFNDFDDEIEAVLKKEFIKNNPNIEWCLEFEGTEYRKISDSSYRVTLKNDKDRKEIEVEKIIICDNRKPSTNFNTNIPFNKNAKDGLIIDSLFKMKGVSNFYAIGETNAIHNYPNQSYYQADLLASNLIQRSNHKIDLFDLSWSLNIDPTISFFGMNKKQIEHSQIKYHEFIYDFKGDYKSSFRGDIGRIKIFTSLKHEILGVIMIGNELEDFIPLFTLMKKNKIKFYNLVNLNVPFFTKAEALREAAIEYEEEFILPSKQQKKQQD